MNIHHVLFFFICSALRGGHTGLVSAKLNIYSAAEGGNGTISCHLSVAASRKFFCKEECKAEDVLVKTDDDVAQRDRYSIKYRNGPSGGGILSVTITRMTKSDSGRYRCGVGRNSLPDSYTDFEIRVSDAPLAGHSGFIRSAVEGDNATFPCSSTVYGRQKFFCKGQCEKDDDILIETDGNRTQSGRYSLEYKEVSTFGLDVTIRQATRSDTGQYSCGYGSALAPDSHKTFPIIILDATPGLSSSSERFTPSSVLPETTDQVTAPSSASCPPYLLYLVVSLPLVVVLMAVLLLLAYKWKTRRSLKTTRGTADSVHMKCPHVKTPPTRTSVTPERIRTQSTESGFHIVQPIMFSMLFLGRSFNMIFVMMVESWSFFRACSASPHMIILKCPACPKIQVFQATVLLKLVQSSISQLFNKSDQVSHCKAEELRGARFPKIHFVFGYFPE
ncbi:polymeric immunoglobulin receptor-like isoform X2 [Chelmon rostratus]|uniref:polymeric immunoglobulin receptor-like isoform X2 n=1 Tax=Chelmon rostratus TaxID=109905 RepID=UPI001BEC4E47|nr:polymeric immunoglobulin receptor-like isoform X2 [Chelmon rostratus]